ncbi:MAG: histidine phosphatase family protein [Bacilli bacterium]|nr:histidine phosphatase family protein [Bacilli bacterium]
MLKILFTRHGTTDWNVKDLIQGQVDIPLNEAGREDARRLAEKLKDERIDMIFASTLGRAVETASIIRGDRDIAIIQDKRILEQYYGSMEGAPRTGEDYHMQRRSYFKRYPGGEGYLDVCQRVFNFFDELKEKYDGKTILVVAHGGMSRLVDCYFGEMENDDFTNHYLGNCELKIFEY